MSSRSYDYSKGSSRSTRDDSRHDERHRDRERDRGRSRSPRSRSPRSHSPRRKHSPSSSRYSKERSWDKDKYDSKYRRSQDEEEVPAPPPPPRISKITMGFQKPMAPIKMNIGGPSKPTVPAPKPSVASVFNDDDDDEPEEMPAEARMRMRNIGRETPTSAGPNSFGKTKQGFCDAKKVFEKNLKQALETVDKPVLPKYPQTIYKIKP